MNFLKIGKIVKQIQDLMAIIALAVASAETLFGDKNGAEKRAFVMEKVKEGIAAAKIKGLQGPLADIMLGVAIDAIVAAFNKHKDDDDDTPPRGGASSVGA